MFEEHEKFMREAIALSESARKKGNHPFGALLVKDGKVILRAENTVNTDKDVTGHAETNLIRLATKTFDEETLSKCTLYTSTEPCVMCAGAIYWAGIRKIVLGCSAERLHNDVKTHELLIPCKQVFQHGAEPTEVIGPMLEEEALKILNTSAW